MLFRLGFLYHSNHVGHALRDLPVALPLVGPQAGGAILDTGLRVGVIAAAVFTQGIEGAVAEDAAEGIGICARMAGEILAGFVLEKIVICHWITSSKLVPGEFIGRRSGEGQLLAGLWVPEPEQTGPEGDLFLTVCLKTKR